MISPDTSQLTRRARDYWNVDGLPTLVGAAIYLTVVAGIFSLAFLMKASITTHHWFLGSLGGSVAILLLMISPFWAMAGLIWLGVNWEDIVEWFKLRITYPRTGYVAPPSYWQSEPAKEPEGDANSREKSRFYRLLNVLGGFWLWLMVFSLPVLGLWSSRTARLLALAVILTSRGLRFWLYLEPRTPIRLANKIQRVREFFFSVLGSFWACILLPSLMTPAHGIRLWLQLGVSIGLWVFLFYDSIRKVSLLRVAVVCFRAAVGCLCIALCVFLLRKQTFESILLALMVPGLCAALVGGVKLFRYLRANPRLS